LPQQSVLNVIVAHISIGFVGDIMDMRGKKLQISPEVQDFFRNCDCLVGNVEASISEVLSEWLPLPCGVTALVRRLLLSILLMNLTLRPLLTLTILTGVLSQ
jgi:hypothetical protein